MNTHVCLIVPDALVVPARNLAACIAPGGHGMWTSALSADGTEPATHWISVGKVQTEFAGLLTDANAAYAAAQYGAEQQGLTLTTTLQDVEALLAQADISNDPGQSALARLGLQSVQDIPPAPEPEPDIE